MSDKILHIKKTPEESVNALNDHIASTGRPLAFCILENLKVIVDFQTRKNYAHSAPVKLPNPTHCYEIEYIINSFKIDSER